VSRCKPLAHGSSDALPFATMGSGSLAAMAVFESDYKEDMNEEEAGAYSRPLFSST
jgi:20S proteasome alpha/beta subunit